MRDYTIGELFCGAGGMALGAGQAGFKHLWASDYDNDACKTFKKNIPCEDVICEDVHSLNLEKLKPVDIFCYGFPCNDFSIVGKRKGIDGNFGGLYKYGVDVIKRVNPLCFVAENVSGLSSANNGFIFKKIMAELSNVGIGYNINVNLYRAEEYGVPQKRHRIIFVGIRKDLDLFYKVPSPTHFKPVTAREAFEDNPITAGAYNNERKKQHPRVVERLEYIEPGQNAWNATLPEHLRLNVKNAKMSQIYKRLHPDQPSYTITGSGGGGTHCYHYSEPRALTNRERARLQSFPDDFIFCGSEESVRKQIGMAVPPLLSYNIFSALRKILRGEDYKNTIGNSQSFYQGEMAL